MSTNLCKRRIWLRVDMLRCYKWQIKTTTKKIRRTIVTLMCWNKRNGIIAPFIFFIRFLWLTMMAKLHFDTDLLPCKYVSQEHMSTAALRLTHISFYSLCSWFISSLFFCQCRDIIFCISLFRFLGCFFLHSLDLCDWSAHWETGEWKVWVSVCHISFSVCRSP